MWRSSKRLIISCIQSVIRCGRSNLEVEDLDDVSDYDVQDVPGNIAIDISMSRFQELHPYKRNLISRRNAIMLRHDKKGRLITSVVCVAIINTISNATCMRGRNSCRLSHFVYL